MKKIQILETVALAAAVLAGICSLVLLLLPDTPSGLKVVLLLEVLVIVACAGVSVWESVRQRQIMDFLVRENRKKKNEDVEWRESEGEKLELMRRRIDLSTLQMQINPHFLYNTLDSIRSQALANGQKDIALMTEKLSRFFRYCISNKENMVKIREETDHILDYYYIQKQRFKDRFEMELKIEDDTLYDYYIPKLTLQPLVENAISHGLEKVKRKGIVSIEIISTEHKVVVKVSDNGIGMPVEALEELNERLRLRQVKVTSKKGRGNGIAIMNVNSRLQLTFGEEYGIHYRSYENMGTEAIVTLPRVDEFIRVRYEELLTMETG